MKLTEADLIKLIPLFMRNDKAVQGLANAISMLIKKAVLDLPRLRTWDQIECMDHQELDDLAWELNVLWYDFGGSLETKREAIRNSDMVWSHLGTVYAVETAMKTAFGKSDLLQFWEYNGRPHYFKINVDNPAVLTDAGEKEFRRVLEIVKRKSQWLENIILKLYSEGNLYAGIVIKETSKENILIDNIQRNEFIGPYVYTGVVMTTTTTENIIIPS